MAIAKPARSDAPAPPRPNATEQTVSELSASLKRTVEDSFGYVRVRGEISGYRGPHSSGHCYFALKDPTAKIDAVIWKGTFGRMRIKPEEGLEVVVTGRLTTYPNKSSYQVVVDTLEPAGVGALMALLEERKRKLAAEGLFDPARKQLLPFLPEVIGVVTSPTGAVIRDILHRLGDRFPRRVIVWPVNVQGEGAAAQVAAAIAGFNALPKDGPLPQPDVLIVARGGGSLEDLWAFNEEIVVRAAAESLIPLISAVGHETDVTLIDHAADRRAPTPTAAAEMAVPVRVELIGEIISKARRALACWQRAQDHRRTELRAASRALPSAEVLLAIPRQRVDAASERLPMALRANAQRHHTQYARLAGRLSPQLLRNRTERHCDRLSALFERARRAMGALAAGRAARLERSGPLLAALSYRGVLSRGYALVRDADGGPITAAATVVPGQAMRIEFADGRVDAVAGGDAATRLRPDATQLRPDAAATPPRPRPRKPPDAGSGNQGSLF